MGEVMLLKGKKKREKNAFGANWLVEQGNENWHGKQICK
jgi:hypothetical protein